MWPPDKHSAQATALPSARRHSYPSWPSAALARMERAKKRLFLLAIPAGLLFLLFQHHRSLSSRGGFSFESTLLDADPPSLVGHDSVNSTLGFGAVVAVSHGRSPRREGLLWAAQLAGIDVVIPDQPWWTEDDVKAFQSKETSSISRGSALAWMGHLNALRWFLSTTLETALVIEDDIDFSLHLLPQATLASRALRALLSPGSSSSKSNVSINDDPEFWAPASSWELLWLGHCNDAAPPQHFLHNPSIAYTDPHMPDRDSITPSISDLLRTFNLTGSRVIYKSHWPLCTFGYAVNRASAARILATYGTEGENGCAAYDVRLLEACRDQGWKCWTVAPELFHHVAGRSEIANVDDVDAKSEEQEGMEEKMEKTINIECGARDDGLWVNRNDTEGRRVMLQRVKEASRNSECFAGRRGHDQSQDSLAVKVGLN